MGEIRHVGVFGCFVFPLVSVTEYDEHAGQADDIRRIRSDMSLYCLISLGFQLRAVWYGMVVGVGWNDESLAWVGFDSAGVVIFV